MRHCFCFSGLKRYFSDIEVMLNRRLGLYWVVMWRFVTPGVIIVSMMSYVIGPIVVNI